MKQQCQQQPILDLPTPQTTVICHGCLEQVPYPLNFPCTHGFCKGTIRYCSESCRKADCSDDGSGMHTSYRCMLVGHHLLPNEDDDYDVENSQPCYIQIGIDGESFPEYIKLSKCDNDYNILKGNAERKEEAVLKFKKHYSPTERSVSCRVGAKGRVALLPNEIDAGGSILIQLCDTEDENAGKFILCDLMVLEAPTFKRNIHRQKMSYATTSSTSLSLQFEEMNKYWMLGVEVWYNDQAYLDAMKLFEKALDVEEEQADIISNLPHQIDEHKIIHEIIKPSLLQCNPTRRIELARRFYFLGMCYLDAERISEGRQCLFEAIRTIRYLQDDSLTARRSILELMLSFEESDQMDAVRTVATWAIDIGCIDWTDVYQRPAFMYSFPEESQHLIQPTYANNCIHRPNWCQALENNYEIILEEFLCLAASRRDVVPSIDTNKINDSNGIHHPLHWPMVGSGEHRNSGHSDGRVVSGRNGGDWREMVLFGSGSNSSSCHAPRTKALIRSLIPDAVSLAEMGGGEVIFSVIDGQTHIKPHCASSNIRLTAHLGLVVPDQYPKCGIRVRDGWYNWKEGEVFIFDDSFEHEVVNNSGSIRAVLLLRYWHPAVPHNRRQEALSNIIAKKEEDLKQKFNPPLPSKYTSVEKRGHGLTSCSRCSRSNHDSIRLVDGNFQCVCGASIP